MAHRCGNVHDNRSAAALISTCVENNRATTLRVRVKARVDTAFGYPTILEMLADRSVAFTTGLSLTRPPRIKHVVEHRRRWDRFDFDADYFELPQRVRPDT